MSEDYSDDPYAGRMQAEFDGMAERELIKAAERRGAEKMIEIAYLMQHWCEDGYEAFKNECLDKFEKVE